MLTFSGYLFIRDAENGRKVAVEVPKYKIGESVYFVLQNVGKFTRDANNLLQANLYMRVYNSDGSLLAKDDNIFGEDFAINTMVENEALESPYAFYKTDNTDKPGIYRFELIIMDKVIGDIISAASEFELYE